MPQDLHNVTLLEEGAGVEAGFRISMTDPGLTGKKEAVGYTKHMDQSTCMSRRIPGDVTETVVGKTVLDCLLHAGEDSLTPVSLSSFDAAQIVKFYRHMSLAFLPSSSSCLRKLVDIIKY